MRIKIDYKGTTEITVVPKSKMQHDPRKAQGSSLNPAVFVWLIKSEPLAHEHSYLTTLLDITS